MRRALLLLVTLAACGLRHGATGPVSPSAGSGSPCWTAEDCPPASLPCFVAACADGACREEVATAGTVPSEQVKGDCKELVCDGRGNAIPREDPADTPEDDGNDCTEERCAGDRVEHAPLSAGAACAKGGVCNGFGVCGTCVPGRGRCTGPTAQIPERCDAMGRWQTDSACKGDAPLCNAGACADPSELAASDGAVCARVSNGARCAGRDRDGILDMERRVRVLERDVAEIAVGLRHACARRTYGAVVCWGDDSYGQLGDGRRGPNDALVRVVGVAGAVQIAAGDAHTCARLGDGTVTCWGLDHRGQLGAGDGKAEKIALPIPSGGERRSVESTESFEQLAFGGDRACGLRSNGAVECWGTGAKVPSPEAAPPPPPPKPHAGKKPPSAAPPPAAPAKRVAGLKKVVEIAAGGSQSCARLADGSVWCWGASGGADRRAPVRIAPMPKAKAIAVGRAHACALVEGGKVRCWGANGAGQLGDGTTRARSSPAEVLLPRAKAIVAHGDHTAVLLDGAGLPMGWGDGAPTPRVLEW